MGARLPERLYWLKMHNPDGRSMLRYRSRGGGKFSSLQAAKDRQAGLKKLHGIESTIYVTQALEWVEVN